MKKPTAFFGTVAVAVALLLSVPTAASAYTPSGPGETQSLAPGATATYAFEGFQAGEDVTFTLTGENASAASLAFIVKTAVESISTSKAADDAGAVTVDVTLPSTAFGTYTLTAEGASSGTSASLTIDTGIAAPDENEQGENENGLSPTGGELGGLGLWIGGGALVLGGGALIAAAAIRRQRHDS